MGEKWRIDACTSRFTGKLATNKDNLRFSDGHVDPNG